MPGGGEPTLFDSIGQSEVAGAGPYYFNAQKPWFLWFCTRGVLINEGSGTARFRLDGSARVVAGESDLVGAGRHIPIPPRVGTDVFADAFPEYLLRPGDVALFEWGTGTTSGTGRMLMGTPCRPTLTAPAPSS